MGSYEKLFFFEGRRGGGRWVVNSQRETHQSLSTAAYAIKLN